MEIIEGYNALKKFAQEHDLSIDDPRLERLYQLEQDAIRDEKSRMAYTVQHAQQEAHRSDAIKMKLKGYPHAEIAGVTGLSINEIMAL